jgi:hypothetical protein
MNGLRENAIAISNPPGFQPFASCKLERTGDLPEHNFRCNGLANAAMYENAQMLGCFRHADGHVLITPVAMKRPTAKQASVLGKRQVYKTHASQNIF